MYYESNMSENTYLLEDDSDNSDENENIENWRQNINDIEDAMKILVDFNGTQSRSISQIHDTDFEDNEIITTTTSQLSFSSPTNSNSSSTISIQSDLSHMEECFVCFENEVNGNLPIKLEDIDKISRQCECRGNIHMECFKNWVNRHQSCPVCRTPYTGNIIIIRTSSGNMRICISIFVSFIISALFLYGYNHHH